MKKRSVNANPQESDGVTRRGRGTRAGDHQRFQVWAKVESDSVIAEVDRAIDKELE